MLCCGNLTHLIGSVQFDFSFLDSCIGRGCNPNLIRWVLDYFIIFLVWKDHLLRGFFLLKLNMLSAFFNLLVWMDLNMSHSYCWFSIKQRWWRFIIWSYWVSSTWWSFTISHNGPSRYILYSEFCVSTYASFNCNQKDSQIYILRVHFNMTYYFLLVHTFTHWC